MTPKIHKEYIRWEDGIVAARTWLKNQGNKYKILFEQNRNMGDTLHLTPIMRHYRNLYPDAAMAFVLGTPYRNVHEFNPHVDRIFLVPSLHPTYRIQMRKELLKYDDIDKMIAPSIYPYGSVWKELSWSHNNIADQYFVNAGIADRKPIGGRKLVVQITDADKEWANKWFRDRKLNAQKCCGIEFNSYSTSPKWNYSKFVRFASQLKTHGITGISIASLKESLITGTVDARGISWRQTVALLNCCKSFIGVGSGITMLAAAADNPPLIFEVSIPSSVSMEGCGYGKSIILGSEDPVSGANKVAHFAKRS